MQLIKEHKKWFAIGGALLAILIVVFAVLPGGSSGASAQEIQEATVQKGNIVSSVSGTGTLEDAAGDDILLPSGITVDEVYVNAGDWVNAGDPIAKFDRTAVNNAVKTLQQQMQQMQSRINNATESTNSYNIGTNISARVKKIYAEVDKSVAETMAEHGALMLLSLDGKMMVTFDTTASLNVGDAVTVRLSDGSTVEGIVESIENGKCTVTLTDNGPAYEEQVTVLDESGAELGSGKLDIHSPMKVTGASGTVSSINVAENAAISGSRSVITLKDFPTSTTYDSYVAQYNEMSRAMEALANIIANDYVLTAQTPGTILEVMVTAGSSTGSSSESSSNGGFGGGSSSSSPVSVFSVSSDEKMVLSVSIDELDILDLSLGQQAIVTLDASTSKVYTGQITRISKGTSSGGVSKYTVEITLQRDEAMRSGMNASATINTSEANDVLTIPVSAVQEFGQRVFVYTEKNGDELSGEVEIETGVSNGIFVEVISGLNEGDTVYYRQSTASDDGMVLFPGGSINIEGGFPGGGSGGRERPEGGGSFTPPEGGDGQ
ncbi:biotin/lipoyl-binding protein [Eubacteriales bacterium OttesenSCG-928-N14]|nr:biotin/lipoyl-binding protein [Eubacteriales bacterium OttesenSCG-928-N14]